MLVTVHRPAAVLWDMDGTIVDTEPLWVDSQRELLSTYDLPQLSPAGEEALIGANLTEAALMFQRLGVPLEPYEIVEWVAGSVVRRLPNELLWQPGVRELLADIRAAGVPQALVTNSPLDMAMLVVEGLPEGTFDAVVGADDVTRGKPHPQPYFLGAERLGVNPGDCIVLEDSVHGLRSGNAAGMTTIAIPHAAPIDESEAHVLLPTLAGVSATDLFQVAGAARA